MTIDERKTNNNVSQNSNVIQNLILEDGEIYNLGYSEKDLEKKSGGGIFNKIFR